MSVDAVPENTRQAVETLCGCLDMGHPLRACDVGIGLGSHDIGVPVVAADTEHM
jgi:hypothetical protein